jgi:type IV secretion system protein TrbL
MRKTRILLLLLGTLAAIALASPSFAASGSILTDLQNQIANTAKGWQSTVMNAAQSLFWILAGIEFGIAAVWLALQAPSLETWAAEIVRRIIYIGFFAFVLQKGPSFAKTVVDSLFQIGGGSGTASPADVFNAGIHVATILSENIKFGLTEDNGLAMASALAMIVVVICFSLVAAIFISVMVEMYVGLMAGMIMLGLGGSSYTKEFALRYLIYAFSVGMKLMALVMIAKMGSDVLTGLSQNVTADGKYVVMLTIAGVSVVVFLISVQVPQMLQGVVQGASVGSGMETIRAGSQAASFAAAGFGGMIGGAQFGAGVKGAYSAAKNEGATASSAAGKAAMAGFGALASGAADKLTGAQGSYGASALGLANAKIREATAARAKPQNGGSSKE